LLNKIRRVILALDSNAFCNNLLLHGGLWYQPNPLVTNDEGESDAATDNSVSIQTSFPVLMPTQGAANFDASQQQFLLTQNPASEMFAGNLAQNGMTNVASNFFPNYQNVGYHAVPAECYSQLHQNLVQPQQRLIPGMLATTSSDKNQPTISLTQTQTIQLTHTIALNDSISSNSSIPASSNSFGDKKLFNSHHFKNSHQIKSNNNNGKG
jgi:hypothetical protein